MTGKDMNKGSNKNGKYLFLCVHPDDLEFSCSNLINYLCKRGKDVEILSLTKGEFGIFQDEWKGPRLARIRVHELKTAAETNGVPPDKVHFGDIIDGFVQFDMENVKYVADLLNKIQPDYLFAPEPYYTYYWHQDHINGGRIAHYLFKRQKKYLKKEIKALYFFTTARSNFWWPFNDPSISYRALEKHKSQMWLLRWNKLMFKPEKHNFAKNRIGPWKYTERYRRIYLNKEEPKPGLLWRIFLRIVSNVNLINPPQSHYIVPNMDSEFGKKVKALREKYNFK
ncbi:MAG: PIG-L deacetylase family protein [Promethearchaeota archaeon]